MNGWNDTQTLAPRILGALYRDTGLLSKSSWACQIMNTDQNLGTQPSVPLFQE